MDCTHQSNYLKEFEAYSKEITSSKVKTQQFLVRSGINKQNGSLSKSYSTNSASSKKSR